jgi:transcriptional regulator with XRE-family HTH domain
MVNINTKRKEKYILDNKKIGEALTRLRGNKSREEVAKANKISLSALIKYESGLRIPRDEVKQRLADYYKRTVQYIFFN